MRVLIVDDSIVFRSQISKALAEVPGLDIVGSAPNGKIAIQKLEQGSIDLLTLDMEMPEMDGLDVLREIKLRNFQVKVIVFSGQTNQGAASALEALSLGAHDVVAKPAGQDVNFENAFLAIRGSLLPKVKQFMAREESSQKTMGLDITIDKTQSSPVRLTPDNISNKYADSIAKRSLINFSPSLIVIGCSTGGPNALEKIFSYLKGKLSIPILIVQHMPPVFTQMLAKRLSDISGIDCQEAKDGEEIIPGKVYLAPGDYHLNINHKNGRSLVHLHQLPQRNSVRPAVDYLFETAASVYGSQCLGVVLTGMGEDGLIGAEALRQSGGRVLIQNKETCVVFGMPGAIFDHGHFDSELPLEQIGPTLFQMARQR